MIDKPTITHDFKTIESISKDGFNGFISIRNLMDDNSIIPKKKGIYLILRNKSEPVFRYPGSGGHFKGKDPNIPVEELNTHWVNDTAVVYIGKAGKEGSRATLHSRLKHYLSFGRSNKSPHWGGRLIWQLDKANELLVCWKELPFDDPRVVEKTLIKAFKEQYGKRPFANLSD